MKRNKQFDLPPDWGDPIIVPVEPIRKPDIGEPSETKDASLNVGSDLKNFFARICGKIFQWSKKTIFGERKVEEQSAPPFDDDWVDRSGPLLNWNEVLFEQTVARSGIRDLPQVRDYLEESRVRELLQRWFLSPPKLKNGKLLRFESWMKRTIPSFPSLTGSQKWILVSRWSDVYRQYIPNLPLLPWTDETRRQIIELLIRFWLSLPKPRQSYAQYLETVVLTWVERGCGGYFGPGSCEKNRSLARRFLGLSND